jgi:TolA-binding protein
LLSSRRRLLQQQINAMNERIATLENDNRELRTQLHEAQRGPSVMADDDQNKKDDCEDGVGRPSVCSGPVFVAGPLAPGDPTAWLGWEDSNSEMSSQTIPLKARADSQGPSRIPARETTRV